MLGFHLICSWVLFDLFVGFVWFVCVSCFMVFSLICFGFVLIFCMYFRLWVCNANYGFDEMLLWTVYELWSNKWEYSFEKNENLHQNICIWAWTGFWGCATFGSAMGIRNESLFGFHRLISVNLYHSKQKETKENKEIIDKTQFQIVQWVKCNQDNSLVWKSVICSCFYRLIAVNSRAKVASSLLSSYC